MSRRVITEQTREDIVLAVLAELEPATAGELTARIEGRTGAGSTYAGGTVYQTVLATLRRLVDAGKVECERGLGPGGAHLWLRTEPPIDMSDFEQVLA